MFPVLLSGSDQDVANHVNRLSSPSGPLISALSNLIIGLKVDGIWDKIEVLNVVHATQADSLLNLRGTAVAADSTVTGTPTFTANQGFVVEGSGNIVSTGITEAGSSYMSQYDAHMMNYIRNQNGAATEVCFAQSYFGVIGGFEDLTTPGLRATIQGGTVTINGTEPGTLISSIRSISDREFVRNDTSSISSATVTDSFGSVFGEFAVNDTATTEVIEHAAWGLGSKLTSSEMAAYEDRLRTYMQARGADVY